MFVCTIIKMQKPITSTEITIKTNPLFSKISTSTSFSTWTSILLTEVVMYQETDRFENNFSLTEKKGSIRLVAPSLICIYTATWRKKLPCYFQRKKKWLTINSLAQLITGLCQVVSKKDGNINLWTLLWNTNIKIGLILKSTLDEVKDLQSRKTKPD